VAQGKEAKLVAETLAISRSSLYPNHVWQSDMTKIWAGPSVGWAYLMSVIDCCTREIVGWGLSLRCRTEEAVAPSTALSWRFCQSSWNGFDFDDRQRHSIYFGTLC
jgi:transposase InsO family protein